MHPAWWDDSGAGACAVGCGGLSGGRLTGTIRATAEDTVANGCRTSRIRPRWHPGVWRAFRRAGWVRVLSVAVRFPCFSGPADIHGGCTGAQRRWQVAGGHSLSGPRVAHGNRGPGITGAGQIGWGGAVGRCGQSRGENRCRFICRLCRRAGAAARGIGCNAGMASTGAGVGGWWGCSGWATCLRAG